MMDRNGQRSLRAHTLAGGSFLVAISLLPWISGGDGRGQSLAAEARGFSRVSEWPVADNASMVAEILAATDDGQVLIYTDSLGKQLGFVDISDPKAPKGAGVLALDGEPTSVSVVGGLALVAVNTRTGFVAPSGHVAVVDTATQKVLARCDVGGQPDSVAASPDGAFLAVAVENERDEDLNEGAIPQLPAGHLAIFDLQTDGMPSNCDGARMVDLTSLAATAGDDPEPEFVTINQNNIVAITLQENNHVALVDLATSQVMGHFSAGTVAVEEIDRTDDGKVSMTESMTGVAREPDGIAWLNDAHVVTANEGDYEGGGRGFTVFDMTGAVVWDSGSETEHAAAELGVYPDSRSENKGTEPETVAVANFDGSDLLFVALERANALMVYEVQNLKPVFLQILKTGVAPEGVLPLSKRKLVAVANEADPGEGLPSTISLFTLIQ
jgi:DNA-binding beta-propeller fold protein YncE